VVAHALLIVIFGSFHIRYPIELVYIRLVKHTIDVGSMKVYLTVG